MTEIDIDQELRALYAERRPLTRKRRLHGLTAVEQEQLAKIEVRIDELEYELDAPAREWHDAVMAKLDKVHEALDRLAERMIRERLR